MINFQPQLTGQRPHFGSADSFGAPNPALSAHRAAPIAQTQAVQPLFGLANPPVADLYKGRTRYVLLPGGTPIFLLHGTSSTGKKMNPMIHWLQREVRSDHPGYVSYVPEIDKATGIDSVEDPRKLVPSALLTVREMGDFRFQLIHQRLQTMNASLNAFPANSPEQDKAIGEFFEIRPAEQKALVPIIRKLLLNPITEVPQDWRKSHPASLKEMSDGAHAKIEAELAKLHLKADQKAMPIHDTDFLSSRAELEGKVSNFDMNRPSADAGVINIRPVHVREISQMEGYLMRMEDSLAAELATVFKAKDKNAPNVDERALLTARKLVDRIAPQMVSIGHSQGGTALMASLINHHQQDPASSKDFKANDARKYEYLGARAMGANVLLSAPVSGIPDIPAWGKKLMDEIDKIEANIPVLRRRKGTISNLIKRYVWFIRTKGTPAVTEMREGSPLMKKIEAAIPDLKDSGVTIISACDKNDSYVEPVASVLRDSDGGHPDNMFNIQLENPLLPAYFADSEDLLRSMLGPVSRITPRKIREAVEKFRREDIVTVEQHRALLTMPDAIFQDIGKQLLSNADNQEQALKPGNFEPFRYQSLVARDRSFSKKCLSLPTPQAAAVLQNFVTEYPHFLDSLIENAREDVPTLNSASAVAQDMLEKTLKLMEDIAANPKLKKEYESTLKQSLKTLADADLPAFTTNKSSMSQRAAKILAQF